MSLKSEIWQKGQGLVTGWRNFWFRPQASYTLGVVRIAFGALVVGWTLLLSSDLYTAFGTKGVMPKPPRREFTWGVFHVYTSDSALLIGWFVLLGAAIALMVGWHSRLAAILVFILILSFERRNPLIFNSGDTVIRIEAMFLAMAPCGAALSLDQRRRTGSFWSAEEVRPWALRLIQIQLTIIYLSTVLAKLAGETWQNGTAVAYSLRQRDLLMFPAPDFVLNNLLIANALTWGTLVIEVAIGVLAWNRRWRPWVLALGVALHLSINLFLEVGFFSASMFVLYLAFIPPDRADALAKGVEKRLSDLTSRFRGRGGAADKENALDLAARDGGDDSVNHNDWADQDERSARRVGQPAVSVSRNGAALHVPKRNGYVPRLGDVRPRRPADVKPNGHRLHEATAAATAAPRPADDEPSGRHALRQTVSDPGEMRWPEDVPRYRSERP